MSIFLTDFEKEQIRVALKKYPEFGTLYWNLVNRVELRSLSLGLPDNEENCLWWYSVSEYLTDAAIVCAIHYMPTETLKCWLRHVTMGIVRRPMGDWVGPKFRDHTSEPPQGHLETAHLSWAVAVVLDLAPNLFSENERLEIESALRDKGIKPCLQWLDTHTHISNWRCILNAGIAVAASVLGDKETMNGAADRYLLCADFFQPDGSYGESIQYGNYALYGLMMAREALVRRDPQLGDKLPLVPHGKKSLWDTYALFYKKPITGWGAYPIARSANFNDSSAVYRASGDVLLHIASRAKEQLPLEAGMARWLFDTLYTPSIEQGLHDRASFGLVNDYGFLTLILWPQAAAAISPESGGLPLVGGFSNGDSFIRDAWDGRTILAAKTGGDPLHAIAHRHRDINSFILVHNRERLLLDPGHSCYRNLSRDLECSSVTHNTCTFYVEETGTGESSSTKHLQQTCHFRRLMENGENGRPVDDGARRLLLAREGDVSVLASEGAKAYGDPIEKFSRFWILCASRVLFIIDHIVSSKPVKTSWNWLLNNRDGLLQLKQPSMDRFIVRRGESGMKLFHLGGGQADGPTYACVHDAYHPLPNQHGEGRPGSGLLMRWTERQAATERTVIHAITMDNPGNVARWHLKPSRHDHVILEAPNATEVWELKIGGNSTSMTIAETVADKRYTVALDEEQKWQLKTDK